MYAKMLSVLIGVVLQEILERNTPRPPRLPGPHSDSNWLK